MISGVFTLLTILKPFLVPLATFLAGVLFPSPLQKQQKEEENIHEAEKKADSTQGNMSDLDHLP